jgi:type VI protein secretion system component Hcp
MAGLYARFPGIRGDCTKYGLSWITLDDLSTSAGVPTSSRRSGAARVSELVLSVHGMTAAPFLALAAAREDTFPFAEIEFTKVERAQELRYLLIRMEGVVIASVTAVLPSNKAPAPGQRVGVVYTRINWTFTPLPSLPQLPLELARLRLG